MLIEVLLWLKSYVDSSNVGELHISTGLHFFLDIRRSYHIKKGFRSILRASYVPGT